MATRVFDSPALSPIQRLFNFIYKASSSLHLPNSEVITSSNGCLQGEVLSSLAFATSVDHIYSEVHRSGSDINTSFAILDDFSTIDDFLSTKACWSKLKSLCHTEKVPINFRKTFVLWPQPAHIPPPPELVSFCADEGISLHHGACKLLGSAVGLNHAKRSQIVSDILSKSTDKFLSVLQHPGISRLVTPHILRLCGISLAHYTAMTIPPSISSDILDTFDKKIIAALSSKLDIPLQDLSSLHNSLKCSLPCSRGGLGLRPQRDICPLSYVTSITRSIPFFPPTLIQHLNLHPAQSLQEVQSICLSLIHDHPSLANVLPKQSPPGLIPVPNDNLCHLPSTGVKRSHTIQGTSLHIIEKDLVASLRSDPRNLTLFKQMDDFADPIARRIFFIVDHDPRKPTFLNDHHASLFYRFYFRLHADSADIPLICPCSAPYDIDHPFSCPDLRRHATTARHDAIVSTINRFLNLHGIRTIVEQRISFANRLRPDFPSITLPNTLAELSADVAFVHTLNSSYRSAPSTQAISNRESSKTNKYQHLLPGSTFSPLVFSTFGRLGVKCFAFIHKICKEIFDYGSGPYDSSVASITYSLVDQILIAIHRGNGRVIQESLKYARGGIRNHRFAAINHPLNPDHEIRASDPHHL